MMSQKDAGKSLIEFMDDVGIPEHLITDGVTEFTGKHMNLSKKQGTCTLCCTLPNRTERIRIMWLNGRLGSLPSIGSCT